MRTPEGGNPRRVEKQMELHYLAPGAFSVISPEKLGFPPPANLPEPITEFRLSPNKKRRRNAAFTIIAELESSRATSRSPSPSGRLSPFKGRGFNPAGSRHVSPTPSPPPPFDDPPSESNKKQSKSNIPITHERRRSSTDNDDLPGNSKTLKNGLSKSLSNVSYTKVHYKPPPSPQKKPIRCTRKSPAITRLSPISGSSPETVPDLPKQNQTSSKIPRSRSTPPSRCTSPPVNKQQQKRTVSRSNSKSNSRDPSPGNNQVVIPVKNNNYKNVKSKVNSFNTAKPKVLPKPQVPSKIEPVQRKNEGRINPTKHNIHTSPRKTTKNIENKRNSSNTIKNNSNSMNNDKKVVTHPEEPAETTGSTENVIKKPEESTSSNDVKKTEEIVTMNDVKKTEETLVTPEEKTPPTSAGLNIITKTATQPLVPTTKTEEQSKEDEKVQKDSVTNGSESTKDSQKPKSAGSNKGFSSAYKACVLFKKGSQERPNSGDKKPTITINNNDKVDLPTKQPIETNENKKNSLELNNHNNHNNNGDNNNRISITSQILNVNGSSRMKEIREINLGSLEVNSSSDNNSKIRSRTIVVTDVKPIQITVREKPSAEDESGNVIVAESPAVNGLGEKSSSNNQSHPTDFIEDSEEKNQKEDNLYQRCVSFLKTKMTCPFCKRNTKMMQNNTHHQEKLNRETIMDENENTSCWNCRRKLKMKQKKEKIKEDLKLVGEEAVKQKWWNRLSCFKKGKSIDKVGPSWNKRRKAWMDVKFGKKKVSETKQNPINSRKQLCGGKSCKDVLKMMFCLSYCDNCRRRKSISELDIKRQASISSKKKSLTPTIPLETPKPKLDLSLVEHNSVMRGAIPILPIPLAWFCLIFNVFLPGIGTVLSGLFCLCFGIPRFSQNDGARQRIGALLIDIVIGCGQLFTVLFCLVGWGWSIWWGIVILKIARKYKKIKQVEKLEESSKINAENLANQTHKDIERGS